MQQAIQVQRAAAAAVSGPDPATPANNAFVINLVSSTTPVALTRPDHAGLKRFTFFMSRRREDGRERFRLHMGYFDTQEEAERLLDIVRTIYPAAWAGLAPGRRLSASATTTSTSAPAATAMPAADARAADPPRAPDAIADARAAAAGTVEHAAAAGSPAPGASSIQVPTLALVPDEGRRRLVDVTEQRAAAVPQSADGGEGRQRRNQQAERSLSSVRRAIASLDDAPTVRVAMPAEAQIPELQPAIIPTLQPVVEQPAAPRRAAAGSESARAAAPPALTDTATLRLLETGSPRTGAAPAAVAAAPTVPSGPTEPRPEAPRTDKPYYAVQLMWSVQPIVLSQVPQLAIFSAYTLYGAEGNRDGRRWYGLRLGFFTDAVSAKQVAHYVRGDFSTVSVVPVSEREREQAKLAVARPGGASKASVTAATAKASKEARRPAAGSAPGAARTSLQTPEFTFIDDLRPSASTPVAAAPRTGSQPSSVGRPLRPGGRPTRGAPGKRAKVRPPGQIHARSHAKPKTLEETLEILGANQLQVDDQPAASLNDSGVRHLRLESAKGKSSKLLKLFDRLSERLGN